MLVRLSVPWTDPFGMVHSAGELVDVDAITLAELEEQGVVDNMTENEPNKVWMGPGSPPKDDEPIETAGWMGPGSPPKDDEPVDPEEGDN